VFIPYNSPYTLPFPASLQPSAVTTAPNVSYPQSNSSGVMALAHATTNFGLRFSGGGSTLPVLQPAVTAACRATR